MKYGLDIPINGGFADTRKLADLAYEAEQTGWDGFFVQDVLSSTEPLVDPWITLTAIAMKTQRMKIGVFLTPLPRRRPWQLARETVTLDHLSGGRLIFGAALGFQALDFAPFGEDYDLKMNAEKLDEGLEVLQGLWGGEAFSFEGKHYHIHDVTFLPKPLQSPRIPVWLAGGWPRRKPLRRAAQWDGIYLMTVNQVTGELLKPEEVQEATAYMCEHRESAEPFEIAINGELSGDADKDTELLHQYCDAGATWWIALDEEPSSFERYRARIRQGPPV